MRFFPRYNILQGKHTGVLFSAPLMIILFWIFADDLPMVFMWMGVVLVSVLMMLIAICRFNWASALLNLGLTLFLIVFMLFFLRYQKDLEFVGEYLHFKLMVHRYESQIAKLPIIHGPRLAVFTLSTDNVVCVENSHLAVYDESDEIMKPTHSVAWIARTRETILSAGNKSVVSLGNHYYLVHISL